MLQKQFETRQEWRNWLENNYDKESEIWIVFYKVKVKKTSLKYSAAVEEALCFGWIDSTVRRIDDEKHMQRYTPRRSKSNWSQSNKERVERLIKEGLMTESGLKSINIAKQNGSWNTLDAIEIELDIPDELKEAFNINPKAEELFDQLCTSRKKQLVWWIASAKRKETKDKRVKETITLLSKKD
jgi:uncharacterized protein YdeI (YjbR/CyaY-like superfamily)